MSNLSFGGSVVGVDPKDPTPGSSTNRQHPANRAPDSLSYEADPEPSERLLFNLTVLALLTIAVVASVWWLSR
jgi:hypothetical protein